MYYLIILGKIETTDFRKAKIELKNCRITFDLSYSYSSRCLGGSDPRNSPVNSMVQIKSHSILFVCGLIWTIESTT